MATLELSEREVRLMRALLLDNHNDSYAGVKARVEAAWRDLPTTQPKCPHSHRCAVAWRDVQELAYHLQVEHGYPVDETREDDALGSAYSAYRKHS